MKQHLFLMQEEMGGGKICPTITGDHQNRITDYTAIVLCLMQADGTVTHPSETSAAQ